MKNDYLNWSKYDELVVETEAIATTVHLELSVRKEEKKPVVLINDDILVGLTQAACANFEMMRDIEEAMQEKKQTATA